MSKVVSHRTTYAQSELPYLYCDTCSRKEYRLIRVGFLCKGWNTSVANAHCKGVLQLSTVVNNSIDVADLTASS